MHKAIFLLLLSISGFAHAQYLVWEKSFQEGFQHNIIDLHQFNNNSFIIRELYRPSSQNIDVMRAVLVDWDGNMMSVDYSPSELIVPNLFPEFPGEVYSLGVNRYLCDWCATGYYGEWMFSKLDLNQSEVIGYYATQNDLSQFDEFNSELTNYQSDYRYPLIKGIYQPTENVLILGGSHVLVKATLFENGYIESYVPQTSPQNIIGVNQSSSGTGLLWTSDSLFDINSDLQLSFIQELEYPLDSLRITNTPDEFLGTRGNTVYKINSQGIFLDSVNFNSVVDELIQFEWTENGYRFLSKINGDIHLKVHQNGIETIDFVPDTVKFKISNFVFSEDNAFFILAGNESSVINNHILLRKYSMGNISYNASDLNLALENVSYLSSSNEGCYTIPDSQFQPIHYGLVRAKLLSEIPQIQLLPSFI
ncbi:MAG: hypothetical protein R2850_05600 [Bacteroidia bacterium]